MIGVICCEQSVAIRYVRSRILDKGETIVEMNMGGRTIKSSNGDIYLFIQSIDQTRGSVFSDVLISPCYVDLVTEARSRIRQ